MAHHQGGDMPPEYHQPAAGGVTVSVTDRQTGRRRSQTHNKVAGFCFFLSTARHFSTSSFPDGRVTVNHGIPAFQRSLISREKPLPEETARYSRRYSAG